MDKKVIYLDDVLETIEKCEHYPLFDTKKIKEGIIDFLGLGIGYLDIKDEIEKLPSVQPEIIHCRDCKHYKFSDNRAFGFPVKRCEWTGFEDVDDDDFCSRAERRTT